jgi:hypothetical protein
MSRPKTGIRYDTAPAQESVVPEHWPAMWVSKVLGWHVDLWWRDG